MSIDSLYVESLKACRTSTLCTFSSVQIREEEVAQIPLLEAVATYLRMVPPEAEVALAQGPILLPEVAVTPLRALPTRRPNLKPNLKPQHRCARFGLICILELKGLMRLDHGHLSFKL